MKPAFITRIEAEHFDLNVNIGKLEAALMAAADKNTTVGTKEHHLLLLEQLKTMKQYSEILEQRLDILNYDLATTNS